MRFSDDKTMSVEVQIILLGNQAREEWATGHMQYFMIPLISFSFHSFPSPQFLENQFTLGKYHRNEITSNKS